MERAALYVRVSTIDKGQTTENQERELREWATRQGLTVVQVYEDRVSGGKGRDKRAGLMAALRGAHRREYDVLLVWALDRLSREGIRAVHTYVDDLVRSKVKLRSLKESWLTLEDGNPVTPLILAIFAWVAMMERRRIGERVRAGMERVRAKGQHVGRKKAPLDIVKVIALLRPGDRDGTCGLSIKAVARQFKVGEGTLRRHLAAHAKAEATSGVRVQ